MTLPHRGVGIGFAALILPVFLPLSALCDEGVSWNFDTSGTVDTVEAQPLRGNNTAGAQDSGDQPNVTIQFQADTLTEVVTEPTASNQSAGQTLDTSLAAPIGGALSPTTSEPKASIVRMTPNEEEGPPLNEVDSISPLDDGAIAPIVLGTANSVVPALDQGPEATTLLSADGIAAGPVIQSTDFASSPVQRPKQRQVVDVNGEDPPAALQETNYTFDKIIVETLAVQDAVFEAEKGILSRRQDKKVVEGDYIPQVNAEVFGQYHIYDNFRDFDPLDEFDISLKADWKVFDFRRKQMKYKSADLSVDISYNQLKTVHNNEVARLLKIYTDYAHQTEKMRLVEAYESLLISLRDEVEGRISGGVGTILEKNQFDQTLNSLRLRKLDASKLLQSAKSDYQLYYSEVFDASNLPTLDSFHIRADAVLGGIFRIDELSLLEKKLKLEMEKAVLEKEISASEYYPDIKVGLEFKKYDIYDNDNEFEILGTLTSKMTLFDGFKRQYSVRSKGELIAGLAAKLRLTKIQKEQRIKRYEIEYENVQNEIENELLKIEKIQKDFDIAKDMTDLKALTFGERISFASDILTSQLRILENYYQQYEILIDVLDLKGGFSDMFEIETAAQRRTL